MDPSSLPVDSPWKALGLPTPEVATITTSATTRRVVLLGAPGSGKRSLCQRLCAAAEAEGKVAVDHDGEGMQPGDSEATTTAAQLPLFTPPKVGDAANLLMSTIADAATPLPASTEVEPSAAGKRRLYRGCGVAHCYISQRLPSVDGVGPGVSSLAHGSAGATTRRRVVEFFCCDSVGALAAALPTPQTLEEAVLLVVVDVSEVASIKSQLDRYLGAVQAYVKGMLRTALPTRGDVRYVQLVEAQQERWATADSSAGDLRRTLYDRKQRELGELFADASVKTENLMLSPVPVVETGVLPLQTIVVCTKTDLLPAESSEILGRDDDVNGPEGSAAGAKVPTPFRTAATRMKLSILALVGQLIRHYAITHRCALAAVSARIMDSSESTSPNAAAHLFIKSFWAYLSSLMEGCGADHGLSVVASQSCTAGFFPFAFLPFGLDTYHVLHNDVNSLAVVFPEQLAPTSDGEPDDAFKLHREYLLDFERAMKAADPRATGETAQEEKMLWDD